MIDAQEEKYLFWLCSIKGVGIGAIRRLMECFDTATRVYMAPEEQLRQKNILNRREQCLLLQSKKESKWKEEWGELDKKGIHFVSYYHDRYPEALRRLYQPPKKLLFKGKLPDPDRIAVSIVGARNCTVYGRDMARLFGCRLAREGIQIISGMALGIDGWGHQGALEGGGETFAVLGSGVEVCYPSRHRALYESVCHHGGVLSEYSIREGVHPAHFPMRNRIISGLSQGILVVEAREKSGSLITADAALEQGKDVFVIPGRIGDELSIGCNRLIRQGAIPVLTPVDIMEYYSIVPQRSCETEGEMGRILSALGTKPVHMDTLADQLGISSTELLKALLQLKKKGLIDESARDLFIKKI